MLVRLVYVGVSDVTVLRYEGSSLEGGGEGENEGRLGTYE